MLGAIVMFFVGWRAKRFKWWHVVVLLFLAMVAVGASASRLRTQGYNPTMEWNFTMMFQQTAISAVLYMGGIWLGIALAKKKALKALPDDDQT